MLVTVSGTPYSGKTTLCHNIAKLPMRIVSAVDILDKYCNTRATYLPKVRKDIVSDVTINSYFAEELSSYKDCSEDIVFDCLTGFNFVKNSFKIFLYCNPEVATYRYLSMYNKFQSADSVESMVRDTAELKRRFEKFYNIDIYNLANYDVVIDTSYASAFDVLNIVKEQLALFKIGKSKKCIKFCPRSIRPTVRLENIDVDLVHNLQVNSFDNKAGILVSASDLYCIDNFEYVIAKSLNKDVFVDCELVEPRVVIGLNNSQLFDMEMFCGHTFGKPGLCMLTSSVDCLKLFYNYLISLGCDESSYDKEIMKLKESTGIKSTEELAKNLYSRGLI